MIIEEEFTIAAPIEDVWAFLTAPERVAAALPGAEIIDKIDDTTYKGGMAVKVGPISAKYRGTVSFELDGAKHFAVVHAKGQGMAGMGTADMRMTSAVQALGDRETQVQVHAEVKISGVLAQLGRGMIERVSKKLFAEFAAAMEQELAAS